MSLVRRVGAAATRSGAACSTTHSTPSAANRSQHVHATARTSASRRRRRGGDASGCRSSRGRAHAGTRRRTSQPSAAMRAIAARARASSARRALARRLEGVGHQRVGGEQVERRVRATSRRSSSSERDEPLARGEAAPPRTSSASACSVVARAPRRSVRAAPPAAADVRASSQPRERSCAREQRRDELSAPRPARRRCARIGNARLRHVRLAAAAPARHRGHVAHDRVRAHAPSRAGRRSPRRAAIPCRPRAAPRAGRRRWRAARAARRRAPAAPSRRRRATSPITSRAPLPPSGVAAASSFCSCVAAAAQRLLELLLERAPLVERAAARGARTASTGVLQRAPPRARARARARAACSNAPRAGERLDAAHARRDARLAQDAEQADLAPCCARACRRTAPSRASGTSTTRTTSPYFSPNSAIAPRGDAPRRTASPSMRTGTRAPDLAVHDRLDLARAAPPAPDRGA